MYCKYCGKQIGDDAKFCGMCGKRQDMVQNETPQGNVEKTESVVDLFVKNKSSILNTITMLINAIIFILALSPIFTINLTVLGYYKTSYDMSIWSLFDINRTISQLITFSDRIDSSSYNFMGLNNLQGGMFLSAGSAVAYPGNDALNWFRIIGIAHIIPLFFMAWDYLTYIRRFSFSHIKAQKNFYPCFNACHLKYSVGPTIAFIVISLITLLAGNFQLNNAIEDVIPLSIMTTVTPSISLIFIYILTGTQVLINRLAKV